MDTYLNPFASVQLIPVFNYLNLLSDFLFGESFLAEVNQKKPIPIVNALYEYLEEYNDNFTMQEKLIRNLLHGSDLYGEQANEVFDEIFVNTMFDYIISSLVFDKYGNIYGFLVDTMCEAESLKIDYLLRIIKEKLFHATFENEYGRKSSLTQLAVNRIFHDIIRPVFPQVERNFNILSLDYIFALAGSTYLRLGEINDTYYSDKKNIKFRFSENLFDEYLLIGQIIKSLLDHKKIEDLTLRVFALPALFHYVSTNYRLNNETIRNVIFSPDHWKVAYRNFFAYIDNTFDIIDNHLMNDNTYKIYTGLSNFKNHATVAETIRNTHCRFLTQFSENIQEQTLQCKKEVLTHVNDWYQEQNYRLGELYGDYDLEITKQCFSKSEIGDLRDVVVKLVVINDKELNDDSNQHFSYDLLEFHNNQTLDYYALIRENYTVTLISEANDPKFFHQQTGPSVHRFIRFAKRITLKIVNQGIEELSQQLMKYKKGQFIQHLNFLDDLQSNDWWKEFGLSLVQFYPSSSNTEGNLFETNHVKMFHNLPEDISSHIVNRNTQNLLSTFGTDIKTLFLKETITALTKTNNISLISSEFDKTLNTVYEKFSLGIEEPKFEISCITPEGINTVQRIIVHLKETNMIYDFKLIDRILNNKKMLIQNSFMAVGVIGDELKQTLYANTVNNRTSYGYKFIFTGKFHNISEISLLRTDYERKEKIFITLGKNLPKLEKIYNKVNFTTLETDSYIYEINNQLRRKSAKIYFSGISGNNEQEDKCFDNEYLVKTKHSYSCLRHWRLVEKNLHLDSAIKSFTNNKTLIMGENYSILNKELRIQLEKYILPDDETFILYFIRKLSNDKEFEKSDWSKNSLIANPDLFNKLRYDIVLENTTVTNDTGKFRIDSIYSYRERLKIEEGTSIENIIRDYNYKKERFLVTFEDYYAVRNFATSGYRRINQDTSEAKLMKLALYKLAVRQSDDLRNEFELKLFRVELVTDDISDNQLYIGRRIVLQKFTLTSTSLSSAIRFAAEPASGFKNILYEMKFTDPYFRAKIKTRVDYFEPIEEKKVILLPPSEFKIEEMMEIKIAGMGIVTRVIMTHDNQINKYDWYKRIMGQITGIKI